MQGIADALTFAAQQQVTINQRQRLEIDGRPYYFDGGGTLRSITPPQAGTLNVATLTGLVDYIQANPDSLYLSEMVLHVGDNRHVHLRSPLVQPWRTRETLVTAQAMVGGDDSRCPFERFRDPEDAILWLNANVVPDDERDELLQALAAIDVSNGAAITDDGISQTVALKTGARLVERGALKNRITALEKNQRTPENVSALETTISANTSDSR